jgi:hypothetical protein
MPGINQKLERVWARNDNEVVYTGRWTFAAAVPDSVPSNKVGGLGMTLTSTGTGLFTLTLDATPAAILHVQPIIVNTTQSVFVLTQTATGATFRTAAYASHATPAHPTTGTILALRVTTLKSLVK